MSAGWIMGESCLSGAGTALEPPLGPRKQKTLELIDRAGEATHRVAPEGRRLGINVYGDYALWLNCVGERVRFVVMMNDAIETA